MGEVKVNFRFNLVKLVVLKALELRKGWYDARGICELTGLRYSTVHTHVGYWAVGMLNKNGLPVGLLRRTPSVSGRRLAWRYAIAYPGKRWLEGVNPELVRDVASKLVSRWVAGIKDYDIPDVEPLRQLTTLLKPNESQNHEQPSVPILPEEPITTTSDIEEVTTDEKFPESMVLEILSSWFNSDEYVHPSVMLRWSEVSFDDRLSALDSAGERESKLRQLAQRVWNLKRNCDGNSKDSV